MAALSMGRGPTRAERWRKPAIVAASVLGLHAARPRPVAADEFTRAAEIGPGDPMPRDRPFTPVELLGLRAEDPAPRGRRRQPAGLAHARAVASSTRRGRRLRRPCRRFPRLGGPAAPASVRPAARRWPSGPRPWATAIGPRSAHQPPRLRRRPDLLSAAERAICDDRFGQRRDGGPDRPRRHDQRRRPSNAAAGPTTPRANTGTAKAAYAGLGPCLRPADARRRSLSVAHPVAHAGRSVAQAGDRSRRRVACTPGPGWIASRHADRCGRRPERADMPRLRARSLRPARAPPAAARRDGRAAPRRPGHAAVGRP